MVADVHREIMHSYGVTHPDDGVALRASFLIDREGVVQHQVVNNLPLGRNVDEIIRLSMPCSSPKNTARSARRDGAKASPA